MSLIPEPYILYAERPEWSDVEPIPQDDGPAPLAPILYNAQYKDATSYFRAIYEKQERSSRVLELTLQIIRLNPAHYTVWQYRYTTLLALRSSLQAELSLLSTLLTTHLKSYQAWNHRRLLLLQLGKGSAKSELAFTEVALRKDAKNYHTWVYRQWLLCNFFSPFKHDEEKIQEVEHLSDDDVVWNSEVDWTASMLEEDLRNNSVWHHRFFVLFEGPKASRDSSVPLSEVDFAKRKIAIAPNNASAWNYLRGVLHHSGTPFGFILSFALPYTQPQAAQPESSEAEKDYLPGKQAQLPCNLALEFVADCYEEQLNEGEQPQESAQRAQKLFDELIGSDPIRKRYWEFRKRGLQKLLAAAT